MVDSDGDAAVSQPKLAAGRGFTAGDCRFTCWQRWPGDCESLHPATLLQRVRRYEAAELAAEV